MHELKHALRQLRLRPGLSVVVIVMLALGIGATTAIFSLYHQILMRPLPVPEPERLVNLSAPGKPGGGGVNDLALGDFDAQFSYPMFRDLEREQTGFTGIAGHTHFMANFNFGDRPTYGNGWLVSGSYFEVLNVRPALGRLIVRDDEPRPGEGAVAVLAYDFWQSRFGGDPSVIGRMLKVNGHDLTIVGVTPEGFAGTNVGMRPQVFVPLSYATVISNLSNHDDRQTYWIYLFARLAPGFTLERAAADLNRVYAGILDDVEAPLLARSDLPAGTLERFRARQIEFSDGARGKSTLAPRSERPLGLLLAVTVLVLLIVCVNIANLLLARGASRVGEMAVRSSLGATRSWLVRQMLAESFVLIAIGGVMSLVVAAGIVRFVTRFLPEGTAVAVSPELSSTALLFTAGASLLTVLVFGLAPAWHVSDTNPADAMNQHARGSGGRAAGRFRAALTMAQIAFSMVLLVLAGLFTRSLMNVSGQDIGMEVESVASFSVTPRLNSYDPQRVADFYDRLEELLAAQPGVLGVGSSGVPLLKNFALPADYLVEGVDVAPGADIRGALGVAGSGFFAALGIPLLAGRSFSDLQDTASAPPVAIVSESFARKFGLGGDVVGRRLGFWRGAQTVYPFEIVGFVEDAKLDAVKGSMQATVYFPRRQAAGAIQSMFYYVRSGVDPDALLAMIPRIVAQIDPEVPVSTLQTMQAEVDDNVYIDRLLSMLSVGFAALATLLAGIGLYGVLAYNVTQRTRELGLRLALGAEPRRLRSMVLKQVGIMAAVGGAIGLATALALGRLAESVLFGLSGRDPLVLTAAVGILATVVLVGSWWPARRAARIAPTEALRYQ